MLFCDVLWNFPKDVLWLDRAEDGTFDERRQVMLATSAKLAQDRRLSRSYTSPRSPPENPLPADICHPRFNQIRSRNISMIAEKSRLPLPCFSNNAYICAASAPSGVEAPLASAAS